MSLPTHTYDTRTGEALLRLVQSMSAALLTIPAGSPGTSGSLNTATGGGPLFGYRSTNSLGGESSRVVPVLGVIVCRTERQLSLFGRMGSDDERAREPSTSDY